MVDVALVVGGGPGISASCARLFSRQGMKVAVAARNIEKSVLENLKADYGVTLIACDAADPASVTAMFDSVSTSLGAPRLVVHNIDGRVKEVFRKSITEVEPDLFLDTLKNSTYSAFLVGQAAAKFMLANPSQDGHRGTILYTNASAAIKGYPQSMARELMPQGIHVAHVPIDAAIGYEQPDGSRQHWLAGETVEDNMAHPDHIADVYLQLHRQHKSTWAFEVILRPWKETW
jgi:NAD(P)-dependent dehydrogenase (short-subunit alcohol dehydrogenase family)